MSQTSETITLEQLADHGSLKSLWIAVHGNVYDLTTFSSDHPGGIEALESCAGSDGTEAYEYAGHSGSNMTRMQKYRVGRLAGSPAEQPSPASHHQSPATAAESKRMRSPTQSGFPRWTKLAVAISAIFFLVALVYQQWGNLFGYVLSTLSISQLQFGSGSGQNIGHAFWAGIAIASSVSCVSFSYFYKLFLSTLDYQNEVFSFPATIPRKSKR